MRPLVAAAFWAVAGLVAILGRPRAVTPEATPEATPCYPDLDLPPPPPGETAEEFRERMERTYGAAH